MPGQSTFRKIRLGGIEQATPSAGFFPKTQSQTTLDGMGHDLKLHKAKTTSPCRNSAFKALKGVGPIPSCIPQTPFQVIDIIEGDLAILDVRAQLLHMLP
ncbi:MAG: hypothetical protein R2724_34555 [Bryobacterales bacterium]